MKFGLSKGFCKPASPDADQFVYLRRRSRFDGPACRQFRLRRFEPANAFLDGRNGGRRHAQLVEPQPDKQFGMGCASGEFAGCAAHAELLVGLGFDELSVAPPSVPAVKERIRGLETPQAELTARRAVEAATASEVHELIGVG